MLRSLFLWLVGLVWASSAFANGQFIIVQSTTSTQNSGLYEAILPEFEALTGIEVRVVAVGTGQAIKNATNCDGDVLLVHAMQDELSFVEAGFGIERFDLMYNDFVVIGPGSDPAGLRNAQSALSAFSKIAESNAIFASRGDDSGTHKKELSLWEDAGVDAISASGSWYRETGSGMGTTLNIAVGMEAYTLTDRATWLSFENKRQHEIVFDGDPALFNQYGVVAINPAHCPKTKSHEAKRFVDWLLKDGQDAIAGFEKNGTQLFFPNAK